MLEGSWDQTFTYCLFLFYQSSSRRAFQQYRSSHNIKINPSSQGKAQLREKVVGDANGESKDIGLYGKSKQRCKMPDRILHACVTKKAPFTPRPKPITSTESTIGAVASLPIRVRGRHRAAERKRCH
jgi:hypothetical protein